MTNKQAEAFKKTILKGQDAPEDLQLWITRTGCAYDVLKTMECKLLTPGVVPELISHDYLDDNDRKNADIMANVAAIDEVFSHITFVAEAIEGNLVGYWHGPEKIALAEASIVLYDTEGQFHLLAGATIIEALLGDYAFDDDEAFIELRDSFKLCGIEITASNPEELRQVEPTTHPEDLANALCITFQKK